MLRSPEHAKETTPARRQSGRGMQTSFEDFTVDAVCTTLPFILSTKAPGPPRRARGLPSFIYMISIMPMNVLFHYSAWHRVRPVGPGARRLVLCGASCSRISSVLAPKPSPARSRSSQSDCLVGRSQRQKGCPHEKWLRTQSTHIVQAGIPPHRLATEQPAGRLLLNLLTF